MLNSLITFIVRYEYARALFDNQAASKFRDNHKASELFKSLALIEVNHAHKLEKFLLSSVVPSRQAFKEHPERTFDLSKNIFLNGFSKNKIWTRFLFKGKSANEWNLDDTLAFCAAAERLETIGYKMLSIFPLYRDLAKSIAIEESNAEERILKILIDNSVNSVLKTKLLILKWYTKAFLSIFILLFTGNK